jgi:hypothetical protein
MPATSLTTYGRTRLWRFALLSTCLSEAAIENEHCVELT